LLEAELLDARLVGRDGRALDADTMLLDGVGRVDRDLVLGLVALLDAEVVVLEVHVEVRVDEGLLDGLPDDAGHLIAVEFDDGSRYLDLRHGVSLWIRGEVCGAAPSADRPSSSLQSSPNYLDVKISLCAPRQGWLACHHGQA